MADFFFKTTRLGYHILFISPKMRYGITAAFGVSITLIWLFFLYKPLEFFIQQQSSSLHHLITLKAEEKIISEQTKKLQKLVSTQKSKLTTLKKSCHNSKSMTELITTIFALAKKEDLTVCSHVPHETTDHEWYNAHSFTSQFQGTFSKMMNFLAAIKKSSFLVYLQSLQINKAREDLLNLTCTFDLYKIKDEL
jgi:Tfp pilus assembly protein PilO